MLRQAPGARSFLWLYLGSRRFSPLKFPQVEALSVVDEFLQRLVDQFSLGLYPAQSLCLPNKFGIKLDMGSHFLHLSMCIFMCIHIRRGGSNYRW